MADIFERVYREYHDDGLFEPTPEAVEYAKQCDLKFRLSPIEISYAADIERDRAARIQNDAKAMESITEIFDYNRKSRFADTVADFLNNIIDPTKIEKITIIDVMDGKERRVFEGTADEIPATIKGSKFQAFDIPGGSLSCFADYNKAGLTIKDMLDCFNNDRTNNICILDAASSDEVFCGNKNDLDNTVSAANFLAIETPARIKIFIYNNAIPEINASNDEDTLLADIIAKNNLLLERASNPLTEEYDIKEALDNHEDLDYVYNKYIVRTNSRDLIERFKAETGYRDALDEARATYAGTILVEGGDTPQKAAAEASAKALEVAMDGAAEIFYDDDEEDLDPLDEKVRIKNDMEEPEETEIECKNRSQVADIITECKNNNKPYSVTRSFKEGYRYKVVIGKAQPKANTEKITEASRKISDADIVKAVDALKANPELQEEGMAEELNESSPESLRNAQALRTELNNKLSHIADLIANKMAELYDVNLDPELIFEDILTDLRLMAGHTTLNELPTAAPNRNIPGAAATVQAHLSSDSNPDYIKSASREQQTKELLQLLDQPQFSDNAICASLASSYFGDKAKNGDLSIFEACMHCKDCEEKNIEEKSEEKESEFDLKEFDRNINEYFNKNYTKSILYNSTKIEKATSDRYIVEGLLQMNSKFLPIRFTLRKQTNINENLSTTSSYIVTNNLSKEKFSFTFDN